LHQSFTRYRDTTEESAGASFYGWFAARPSGTEALYKIYAESFRGPEPLRRIQEEAQALISAVFAQESDGGAQDA